MNPFVAVQTLNRFLYQAYGANALRHVNTHVAMEGRDRVISVGPGSDVGMIAPDGLSFDEYCRLISEERYSFLLADCSLISLEWQVRDNVITRHRYMYIPCPVRRDVLGDCPPEMGIGDYLMQLDRAAVAQNLLSHGYLRFDYTTDLVKEDLYHPLSHLTFISSDCRIALRAPISVSDFLTFVFENFHSAVSEIWAEFQPHLRTACEDTIRVDEMSRMHIYWADEI